MPMIAASTGAIFRPRASPAARPSCTTSTFSCTPAPTPSTARNAGPRGVLRRASAAGRAAVSRPRTSRASASQTTVPTTRAICISYRSTVQWSTMPDDAGIGRHFGRVKRKARLLAANEEDFFADAGANRIDGHERPSGRLAFGCQRLEHQQFQAVQVRVLAGHDDVTDHASQLHGSAHSSPRWCRRCRRWPHRPDSPSGPTPSAPSCR